MSILEDSSMFPWLENRAKLAEARKLILRQGQKRFGPPDEAVATAMRAIDDLERLERLSDRLLDVTSWSELLATP